MAARVLLVAKEVNEEEELLLLVFGVEYKDILDRVSPRRTDVSDLFLECMLRRLEWAFAEAIADGWVFALEEAVEPFVDGVGDPMRSE